MKKDNIEIPEYDDTKHAEVLDDIHIGEYSYKYRVLEGIIMPPYITPDRYHLSRTIQTRNGDICFISYPKSGSTWLSYILLLLIRSGDIPEEKTLRDCFHWVASSWPYPRSKDELDALPSPRIFKSHMPYNMALGGNPAGNPCKYIYIARNPKDVAVSYYHFESGKKWSGNYSGPWEHWLKIFMEGRVQRGDWFDHVLSWWKHSDNGNILFLKYEDLMNNFETQLEKIARFLHCPLTADVISKIQEKTSFTRMKQDKFSNLHEIAELGGFFRKGQIGSWKERFTVAQNELFDALYAVRMKDSGLEFEFE
jgi:hypothetical protein